MQIKLSSDGPPMWFLGDPKQLVASLTYVEPGPVEVDFQALGDAEQKAVLTAVQRGVVESDIPFQELYQVWLKSKSPVPQPSPTGNQEQIRQAAVQAMQERLIQRQAVAQKKEGKFQSRCEYLISQNVIGLKSAVQNEKNERVLHNLLKLEQSGKQRVSVVKLIHEKLRRIEAARARKIDKATRRQIRSDRLKQQTSAMSVVESEQETITLTPEDLIAAAATQ